MDSLAYLLRCAAARSNSAVVLYPWASCQSKMGTISAGNCNSTTKEIHRYMIDTLSLSRELANSGIKREHAEAIADAVSKAVAHKNGSLASTEFVYTHVDEVQKDVNAKIDALRVEVGELRLEISEFRNDVDAKIASVHVKISEFRNDVDAKIASVHVEISELRADMETRVSASDAKTSAIESRLIRWIVGTGIALGIVQAFDDFVSSPLSGLL